MKAAIFDMDGTIIDSMKMWNEVFPELIQEYDIVPDEDFRIKTSHFGMYQMANFVVENFDPETTTDVLWKKWADIVYNRYLTDAFVKDGALEYLKSLKEANIPVAIATLTDHYIADRVLEHFGLSEYCNYILTVEDVGGVSKRKPDLFLKAAGLLKTAPEDCMVFEDSLYAVIPAVAAGFKTCGIKDTGKYDDFEKLKEHCDISVESWRELLTNVLKS